MLHFMEKNTILDIIVELFKETDMKQVVTVRNLTIGEGMPKICVPIIASTEAEILAKAEEIMNYPADLIEWRADYFEDAYNLSAVAIRCWSELQHLLKITPCAVMGIFNECKIPVVCETDASNAILMAALTYASDLPTGCLDINNNYGTEENKCILFHCGPLPKSLMADKGDIQEHKMFVKTQGENCSWGVNVGNIKPGDITIAGCRTEDGEIKYFSFDAKISEDKIEKEFFGACGVLETENLQNKLLALLENGFRHHSLITTGHHYEIVKEALNKYLGYKEIKL